VPFLFLSLLTYEKEEEEEEEEEEAVTRTRRAANRGDDVEWGEKGKEGRKEVGQRRRTKRHTEETRKDCMMHA